MRLADRLVATCEPYLGSATSELLGQAAKGLVGTDMSALRVEQLESLAYWVRITVLRRALLVEQDVERLVAAISRLRAVAPTDRYVELAATSTKGCAVVDERRRAGDADRRELADA